MRRPPNLFVPLVLAAVLAIGFAATQVGRDAEAAGAILEHPKAECGLTSSNVTLSWRTVSGATAQRLEYTLEDNGFAAGTFKSISLTNSQTSYSAPPLSENTPNLWRVVSTTAAGDVASETNAFTPCDSPRLLWGVTECRNYSSATMTFRWAPLANFGGEQWLEIDYEGDWTGSDTMRIGPLSPSLDSLQRGGFHSDQLYHFRVLRLENDGSVTTSETGWFLPECLPYVNPELYGSDDRLIMPAIGVDAPINVRDVGWDGALGVPLGGHDVVRYNFPLYEELQGAVGGPGPKVIGGHYDYHVIGPAIFWDLKQSQAGDTIEYWDGGVKYTYVVDWVANIPFDESLNPYIAASGSDSLLIITCNGDFDRGLYGGYNLRTLVHAIRQ